MSQSLMKLIEERKVEPVSVKTAWQIYRGDRSADPTHLSLIQARQELATLEKILTEAKCSTEGGLRAAIRALIMQKSLAENQAGRLELQLKLAKDFIETQGDRCKQFVSGESLANMDIPEKPKATEESEGGPPS